MKRFFAGFQLLLLSICATSAFAADFSEGEYGVRISGPIVKGDYARFREYLLDGPRFLRFSRVWLSSPGGDVTEALKFANLFDKAFIPTWVGPMDTCASSCFIMWAGGVERTVMSTGWLGVHRITLRDSESDIQKAKGMISPLASDVSKYLAELGIPRALIDKMNETPASGIYRFDSLDINSNGWYLALNYQPIYLDLAEKTCGRFPDPYPGQTVREKPRDAETTTKIKDWTDCLQRVRVSNRGRFFREEERAAEQGRQTLLYTKEKLPSIREAFKF
ncbi:MAG: hypothetical protein Q7T39_00150 [Polaromonas sp.]|nr:hypothetical protein [Polaromonas sp.]